MVFLHPGAFLANGCAFESTVESRWCLNASPRQQSGYYSVRNRRNWPTTRRFILFHAQEFSKEFCLVQAHFYILLLLDVFSVNGLHGTSTNPIFHICLLTHPSFHAASWRETMAQPWQTGACQWEASQRAVPLTKAPGTKNSEQREQTFWLELLDSANVLARILGFTSCDLESN